MESGDYGMFAIGVREAHHGRCNRLSGCRSRTENGVFLPNCGAMLFLPGGGSPGCLSWKDKAHHFIDLLVRLLLDGNELLGCKSGYPPGAGVNPG
jgi:hypothetical protein